MQDRGNGRFGTAGKRFAYCAYEQAGCMRRPQQYHPAQPSIAEPGFTRLYKARATICVWVWARLRRKLPPFPSGRNGFKGTWLPQEAGTHFLPSPRSTAAATANTPLPLLTISS